MEEAGRVSSPSPECSATRVMKCLLRSSRNGMECMCSLKVRGTGNTVEEIWLETSIINKIHILGVVHQEIIAKCGC
jgi:hypothetical protein